MQSTLTRPAVEPAEKRREAPPPSGGPRSLAFLTYVNRSGSTLLARLLDAYEDVAVSLEAQFPDTIVVRGYRVRTPEELDRFLDRILADPKVSSWGLDRDRLRERLSREGFPVPYPRFLRTVLAEHLAGKPSRIQLYKNGRYLERPDRVRQLFPDSKFVFVLRDLRAVYASQKRSLDSRSGKPMTSNPALTAHEYLWAIREVERLAREPWFLVVRYEDLVARPDEEVARVLRFLGASDARRDSEDDYAAKIPEGQKHLHGNVASAPMKSRTDAWRAELTREVAVLEAVAGPALSRWGYELIEARPRGASARVSQAVTRLFGGLIYLTKRVRWNLWTRPRL